MAKKKAKTSQQKKTSLKKKLDRILQLKYTPLYSKCLICDNPPSCMHHYILKSQSNYLRYDERNLVPICSKCHTLLHRCGDPRINQQIIKIKGHEWADTLEEDRRKYFKDTLENLKELEKKWK